MGRIHANSTFIALLLALSPIVPAAFALGQQSPPAYLNALADLRYARALLDTSAYHDVSPLTAKAVDQIDMAIKDIKEAAIDDGKSLNEHPPVDSTKKPHERFQDALAALNRAHTDVARAEDDPKAKGLRVQALHDIDAARIHTQQAYQRTLAEDPKH